MKVSNNNPNQKRKPLTKNQKIIAIIFIILGGLFVVNEFAERINRESSEPVWRKTYCDRLFQRDISLYLKDEECRK